MMRRVLLRLLAFGLVATQARATDWSQWGFDSRHSGVNDRETTIHSGNVGGLHLLYSVTLPAIADGAPAFLSAVDTPQGLKDLLFLTTKAGALLAVDAETGGLVWSKQPATGPNYTTSSPAIDPDRQFVYSYGLDGKAHKYQVGDGTEITTGGWPQIATLKPIVEKGSSALALATAKNGVSWLYVANGGYPGDAGDYQGHVTAVNLATGAQNVFNANCSGQTVHFVIQPGLPDCPAVQTAIWARPGVIYDVDNDRILMATGNGTFSPASGPDWGDSVFSLHADGTGSGAGLPVDSYTPVNFQQLQNADADLGSTAPAYLPPVPASLFPHLAVQSGKDLAIRLLNRDNLSGQGGAGHTGGELQLISVPQGGVVLTQPAVWVNPADQSVWVFISNGSGISGLQLTVNSGGVPSLVPRWTKLFGGSSPVLANGILYYAGSGTIHAFDPTTGASLWSDATIGLIHWESPIVVQGRVYLTDEASHLTAWVPPPGNTKFFTLMPCRVLDTRNLPGPIGGPSLPANGGTRVFPVAGQCGVPTDAIAVAANVAVVSRGAPGHLQAVPAGVASSTSLLNFEAGQIISNSAVLLVTGSPAGSVSLGNFSAAPLDVIMDVSGYFR